MPTVEVGFLGPAARPGGYYLAHAQDVFTFTLYWMLVFHLPFNLLAGAYALFNLSFPPQTKRDAVLLASPRSSHAHSHRHHPPTEETHLPIRIRTNARRSRFIFSLLVFFSFLFTGLVSAVLGSVVLAWMIVGVYRAGGFYVSTWIPFVWAVIQSLIALLEIWPTIIDII